jgi:hypothetical protein
MLALLLLCTSCSKQAQNVNDEKNSSGEEINANENTNTENVKVGNTQGNLNNYGIVAGQGEWVYYSNSDMGLYKMKTDGSQKTKLSDEEGGAINVYDNWVYCLASTDRDTSAIYRIKTDGSEPHNMTDDSIASMSVVGDWIYFSDIEGNIKKLSHDGKNTIKLASDSNGWIYYAGFNEDGSICTYKINTDGENKTKISDSWMDYLSINNGWMYYLTDDKIYRMKLDGTDAMKVCDDGVYEFNVSGDWIYYSNDSDEGKIYKIKTDGSTKTKVSDDISMRICLVDDWIYYDIDDSNDVWESIIKLCRIKTDGSQRQIIE